MKWDYGDAVEDFNATGAGLFITNEGNFQYGMLPCPITTRQPNKCKTRSSSEPTA